jgi:hypothetical protein
MSNDRLEELLQDWTAARINFSSKHSNRSVRLWKLINQIPESHRVEPFSTGDEKTKPPHYVEPQKLPPPRKGVASEKTFEQVDDRKGRGKQA